MADLAGEIVEEAARRQEEPVDPTLVAGFSGVPLMLDWPERTDEEWSADPLQRLGGTIRQDEIYDDSPADLAERHDRR
ncbi:MAG: hypothetical protein IT210_07850 [Armatimonadetes bacterium]|nr:hypothetical protein [Armatimonadota bacterium]